MHRLHVNASWAAPVVGAGLFAAGVLQARKLAAGGVGSAAQAARSTGGTRLAIGTLLIAKPELMARLLHGNDDTDAQTRLHLRMLAVREIAFGVGTVLSARTERDVRRWLLALALVDTGEALVLLPATQRRTVSPAVGLAFAAADLGSSAAGIGVAAQILRERRTWASRRSPT